MTAFLAFLARIPDYLPIVQAIWPLVSELITIIKTAQSGQLPTPSEVAARLQAATQEANAALAALPARLAANDKMIDDQIATLAAEEAPTPPTPAVFGVGVAEPQPDEP